MKINKVKLGLRVGVLKVDNIGVLCIFMLHDGSLMSCEKQNYMRLSKKYFG